MAEVERDRLKSINLALQQRLADYLHKRKVFLWRNSNRSLSE